MAFDLATLPLHAPSQVGDLGTKDPEEEFKAAVKVADWATAAGILDKLPDTKIQSLIAGLATDTLEKLDSAAVKLATLEGRTDRVHRHVSFKQNEPEPAEPHPDGAPVQDAGTELVRREAGGGLVSVHADVVLGTGEETEDGYFSVGYKGPESETSHWLQFIWREILVDHPPKPEFRVEGRIETTSGSYDLTTDPSKPNYNVDARLGSPFYDMSEAANNRSEEAFTIFDKPEAMAKICRPYMKDGARKVTSRAHFTDYLIRDMAVLYQVGVSVEMVYTRELYESSMPPPPKATLKEHLVTDGLDPLMRARLQSQYTAKYDYIPEASPVVVAPPGR